MTRSLELGGWLAGSLGGLGLGAVYTIVVLVEEVVAVGTFVTAMVEVVEEVVVVVENSSNVVLYLWSRY